MLNCTMRRDRLSASSLGSEPSRQMNRSRSEQQKGRVVVGRSTAGQKPDDAADHEGYASAHEQGAVRAGVPDRSALGGRIGGSAGAVAIQRQQPGGGGDRDRACAE